MIKIKLYNISNYYSITFIIIILGNSRKFYIPRLLENSFRQFFLTLDSTAFNIELQRLAETINLICFKILTNS